MTHFDRYSIQGIYNLFSHKIVIKSWKEIPVFVHEFYHHVQNSATVHGAERFNLLMQLLAHTSNLCSSYENICLPINKWFENEKANENFNPKLKKRLDEIVYHQDFWAFMEKTPYPYADSNYTNQLTIELTEDAFFCGNPFLAVCDDTDFLIKNINFSPESEKSYTPYIINHNEEDKKLIGYGIGGFTIMESGAYALQLFHEKKGDEVLNLLSDPEKRPYLLVLYYVYQFIDDFSVACLLTFLVCDLSMCLSTPAVGFLVVAQLVAETTKPNITIQEAFEWYNFHFAETLDEEIQNSFTLERQVIEDIKNQTKNRLTEHSLDDAFVYELSLMEKAFQYNDIEKRLPFLYFLTVAKDEEDIYKLLTFFETTVIEIDEHYHCNSEINYDAYTLFNAVSDLFIGLCRDFNYILERPQIAKHFVKQNYNKYLIAIEVENGNSDAYGYLLHTFGLQNKTITFLDAPKPVDFRRK